MFEMLSQQVVSQGDGVQPNRGIQGVQLLHEPQETYIT